MTRAFKSRLFFSFLVLSLALLLPLIQTSRTSADEKDDKQDLKQLQGTWVVVEAERNGQPLDRIKGNQLIVKDNQFTVVTKSAELKGDITLDAAKKPKRIDMQHQEGMLLEKKWEGIYKIEGGKLTLCYAEADSGRDRPGEFKTEADSSRLLIVMERKKP
jgi:uncharacterized protein (TIGR03067 family)